MALTLALGAGSVASADTIYPTNANSFAGDTQNWTDAQHDAALTLGPLTLPVCAITPLLCNTTNDYSAGTGNPPGSIRTSFTAAANLLGLFTGTGMWQSPKFTVASTATNATFGFDRKGDISGAININGNAKYTVTLVDITASATDQTKWVRTAIPMTTLSNVTKTDANFLHDAATKLIPVTAGHTYVLQIQTTLTTSLLQAALNPISVYYDNVKLQVADGTGDHVNPAAAETLGATDVTATTATINGAVNPYAEQSYAQFDVGTTDQYGTQTPRVDTGSGSGFTPVSAALTGLSPCTTYHYRVRAANTINTPTPQTDATKDTLGTDVTFNTWCAPEAHTIGAAPISATTATLNGTVNPNGPTTTYHYEWGATTAYGNTTPDRSAGDGTDTKAPLSEPITGLTPTGTYHFRIVATNELGTSFGEDRIFQTPQESGPGPQGQTGSAGATGAPGPAGPAGKNGKNGVVSNSILKNGDVRGLLIIRSRVARVGLKGARAGQIRLPIFCKKETGRTCAGTVKIRTRGLINPSSLGRKKAKRRVTLATFEYQLQAGKKGYAISTIQPEKLRLMRRLRSVKVNISVQVTDSNNNRQTIVQPGVFKAQNTV